MTKFGPADWLCAALGAGGAADAFKVVEASFNGAGTMIRVLHKDTGAVWRFDCVLEREAVK